MDLILNSYGNMGIWIVACASRHGHPHRQASQPVVLLQNELPAFLEHSYITGVLPAWWGTPTFHQECHAVSKWAVPWPVDWLWKSTELTSSQSSGFPCVGLHEKHDVWTQCGHMISTTSTNFWWVNNPVVLVSSYISQSKESECASKLTTKFWTFIKLNCTVFLYIVLQTEMHRFFPLHN